MSIAPNGQRLTHIPQPMQRGSDIFAFLSGPTYMQSVPSRFMGQSFAHR